MNKRLYVGNLPFNASEEKLKELFGTAGTVESTHVVRDWDTGRGRGFAFVEMATEQDAQNAIKMLNEHRMDGRPLTVNEARPQRERQGALKPRRDDPARRRNRP